MSLGAREYFLKSELRAADIEAFIEGVLKIKEELAVIKKEDVFPSGCIDLFRLFKHQEEVDIVDQFWAKQGMAEKEAYLVLALETTHDPELWRLILQVPAKVLRSSMGKIYTAVSRIRGNHYLVLQAADESLLDSLAHAFADMIGDTTSLSVGISPVHHSRSDYMTASNQASLALNALFFSSKTMAHFEDLRACPLDRAHFHSEKAAVLDLVAQRRYGEASAAISSWFDALTCAGPPDIDWAIDYCRRMVLAIEERYYQLTNTSTQEIQPQKTLVACKNRCQDLLDKLETQETGKLSDTIRSAVQYIHDHYGRPISLAEVAGHVYRSPEYFSRQFKNEIGENFSVYLTLYRLGQAQELLRKSDLLISEVAARVGYNSAGYFSRLYKKYKGIPPEQERMSK